MVCRLGRQEKDPGHATAEIAATIPVGFFRDIQPSPHLLLLDRFTPGGEGTPDVDLAVPYCYVFDLKLTYSVHFVLCNNLFLTPPWI